MGAAAATLMPLNEVISRHLFAGERIHADDATVPSPRARPESVGFGRMFAMTGRSAVEIRLRRYSSIHPTALANIQSGIWQAIPD